ncbi:MAG: HAMP domain-containing histidine kinase [Campylobacterales bacterium]|nr:HAMP domain-containing histidine kinase [Campylobacterales bacterium]
MFKSLKRKVLFYFATATLFLLVLFNTAIYYFFEQNTKLSIQNKLYDKAVFINKNIINNVSVDKLFEDEQLKSLDVAIIKDNKIIYNKGNIDFNNYIEFIKKDDSFFVFKENGSLNGMYVLRVSNPFQGAILFYQYSVDKQINHEFDQIKHILMILEPLLFIVLLFFANGLVNKILRSINNITKTANKIYVTDLSGQIPSSEYDDEVQDLVDSFNKMISRLKYGIEHLEQFNSDVSHELKTPLTVIRGEIEIALNKTRDTQYYEKSLKTIEQETLSIQEIVDNLLLMTKYTKENISQTFETINLDSILLDTIDKHKSSIKQKNIKVNIDKLESISITANPTLIATIFSNLIDNSIKYTPNDKNITISLYNENDKVYFIIEDEGIGIAKSDLSKIMTRFYRVDESRNKKIKGFGLGLSIVQNSVDLHNGNIEIQSEENQGTKITIIL